MTRPELIEIVASNIALTPRDQRRVSNFIIRVQLKRASDVARPASAAAAPGASGAAPVAASSAAVKR